MFALASGAAGLAACGDISAPGRPAQLLADRIAAGEAHACAITLEGKAVCWGMGDHGALGTGGRSNEWRPAHVMTAARFAWVSAGGRHSCGVTVAGAALCWGANDHGQLGTGEPAGSTTPAPAAGDLVFREVSAGADHSCGITNGGVAYCWGRNASGQLGDGTYTSRPLPTAVATEVRFQAISAGARHTCAVATNGLAHCWGANEVGQLGRGQNLAPSPVPVAVAGNPAFLKVAAGTFHTCGVTTANRTNCWGGNAYGELGRGWRATPGEAGATTPLPVLGDWRHRLVMAGDQFTCAIMEEPRRRSQCWGRADHGQAGPLLHPNPFAEYVPTPRWVSFDLRFAELATGGVFACGRTTAGEVYCWGTGEQGQLGNQLDWLSEVPVRVLAPAT